MVLTLDGELDTGSMTEVCDLISELLAEGSRHLLVDWSAVTRCDNASLYTLYGVRLAMHEAHGSLSLGNPSRSVQRALSCCPLKDRLSLHDTPACRCG